jgi:hypothetical protein
MQFSRIFVERNEIRDPSFFSRKNGKIDRD